MKNIFLGFCLMSLPGIVHPQSERVNRASYNLNGKVRSVTEYSYENEFWEKGPFRKNKKKDSVILVFNDKGWLIEKVSSRESGLIEYLSMTRDDFYVGTLLIKYEYNPAGRLLKESVYEYRELPEYLKAAMKKEAAFSVVLEYVHTYDSTGRIWIVRQFDMPGKLLSSENIHRYDGRSKLMEETYRDISPQTNAITLSKTEYRYDSKGQLSTERTLNTGGQLDQQIQYDYDENGKLREYRSTRGDGSFVARETYRYNQEGRIIEKIIYNKEGKTTEQFSFAYDGRGNQVSYNWFNAADKKSTAYTFKYKFDERGNWISRERWEGPEMTGLAERIIEYEK